jgi:hypothetical protein
MITINATGDTTLHTAGKYCPEDILVKVPAGGSGGSVETCTVTMNVPGYIAVIGYGTYDRYCNGSNLGTITIPSTGGFSHIFPMESIMIFRNVPVGSVFTFCVDKSMSSSDKIKGVSVTDSIEFSLVNMTSAATAEYYVAVCRCNGDGEITITD